MTWLGDVNTPPVTLGTSPSGISIGWPTPHHAFQSLVVCEVVFMWTCSGCVNVNQPLTVKAHPLSGVNKPRVTDWRGVDLIEAIGLTSLVCPIVANETTPWEQIKDIYSKQ